MASSVISKISLITFWWVSVILGSYFLYQLILYMKNKPPGHQSLLDVLYKDLFKNWIVSTVIFTIAMTLMELETKSWVASMIVGWPSFTLVIRSHIHLMLSGIVKFGLTFHQGSLEEIPERLIKQYIW